MSTTTTTLASATQSLIPALPPPNGVESNFEHPESLLWAMDVAMAVAIPLATIFFGLRSYVRLWIKRQWIIEDWLALIAYVGTISFCGTGVATMMHHGGQHEWDITKDQAMEASYWFNIASIHYGITICIAKLAILSLYRRAFSPFPGSVFDIICKVLIALLVLFYVATNLIKIWECIPRAKIWDTSLPGHCVDTPTLLNISGVFNTVTDFILVFLPVRAVWDMQMSFKQKTVVVLAFTFGSCAPGFSLVGAIVRFQGSGNPDKTWVQPDIIMWGLAELTTGILCVSFPEMGVLRKKKAWSRKGLASTSIREGRHHHENAIFQGPGHFQRFEVSATRGTFLDTMARTIGKPDDTISANELDEISLINRQRLSDPQRPVSYTHTQTQSADDISCNDPAHTNKDPSKWVQVTRELKVESVALNPNSDHV